MLPVTDGHEIYLERSGNADGEPLLFLHGGPGSGSSPDTRRLFDPTRFHIIQFDQRGSGLSRPHGSLENNTTGKIIDDMQHLLEHLQLQSVHLAGGSWGSTLALAYGLKHPERLRSLLLYGVFLCRKSELQALYFHGGVAQQLHPETFEAFLALLPPEARDDPIEGYRQLFNSCHKQVRTKALNMWSRLEKTVSRLEASEDELRFQLLDPDYVLAHSLIENHYFRHDCFLEVEGESLLDDIGRKLAHIPTHIIAGRYDTVCPPATAYELHKALPGSALTIVPASGHTFYEPRITDALMLAVQMLPTV